MYFSLAEDFDLFLTFKLDYRGDYNNNFHWLVVYARNSFSFCGNGERLTMNLVFGSENFRPIIHYGNKMQKQPSEKVKK